MNTVVIGDLAKTVAMQKELFNCFRDDQLVQIRELETFIEIIERKTRSTVTGVEKRVEVAECIKDLEAGTVRCRARDLDLGPASNVPPLLGCQPLGQDPLDMNTVVLGDFAKTIKVEKEVFKCVRVPRQPAEIGDLYIFTEIIERKVTIAPADAPFTTIRRVGNTRFEGIVCFKEAHSAVLPRRVECRQFNTQ